jgi:hypothetical protein
MKASFHPLYIAGSVIAGLVAVFGIAADSPVVYGIVPGIIGGAMVIIAGVRFFRDRTDLVGFVSTGLGFVYYQAYQANPVMLPVFTASLFSVPKEDQTIGILLSNLTAALLLVGYRVMSGVFRGPIGTFVPPADPLMRAKYDGPIMAGFCITFAFVAIPNVLFGRVVMGSIDSILYQRLSWSGTDEYSGYAVFGGAVGGSAVNLGLWTSSLFLFWMYLLRSRFRVVMLVLSPLVVLWTAGVAMQGSRTYLMAAAVSVAVYAMADPRYGRKAFYLAIWGAPLLLVLMQVSTLFRGTGLVGANTEELSSHFLEIEGNEGVANQIDGVEYFRTELLGRGVAPNPFVGAVKGILMRPVEGLLMPVPRTLFPWKPEDQSVKEFTLFYQNVRLGVESDETFMGASPGLFGQELIEFGILGPLTLLFWMGLLLALAERLFSTDCTSDFHRIFAAMLMAFVAAQARGYSSLWFLPFIPAGLVFAWVAHRSRGRGAALKTGRVPSQPGLQAGRR